MFDMTLKQHILIPVLILILPVAILTVGMLREKSGSGNPVRVLTAQLQRGDLRPDVRAIAISLSACGMLIAAGYNAAAVHSVRRHSWKLALVTSVAVLSFSYCGARS